MVMYGDIEDGGDGDGAAGNGPVAADGGGFDVQAGAVAVEAQLDGDNHGAEIQVLVKIVFGWYSTNTFKLMMTNSCVQRTIGFICCKKSSPTRTSSRSLTKKEMQPMSRNAACNNINVYSFIPASSWWNAFARRKFAWRW